MPGSLQEMMQAGQAMLLSKPSTAARVRTLYQSAPDREPAVEDFAFDETDTVSEMRTDYRKTQHVEGRVVRREPGLVVVELEVPDRGLIVPGGDGFFAVELDDGTIVRAELDEARSTKPGPHEPGLTVRLALRLKADRAGREPVLVLWGDRAMSSLLQHYKSGRLPRHAARLASVRVVLRKSR
jgi:hypothetical protein